MGKPHPCPVVGCAGTALVSHVIALLPSAGSGRCRTVIACSHCWRAVGDGARMHVEYDPDDTGRRRPRVLLGALARTTTPFGHRTAPG